MTAMQYVDTLYSIQNDMILQTDSFFQAIHFDQYNAALFYQKAIMKQAENEKHLQHIGIFNKETAPYLAMQQICSTMNDVLQNNGLTLLNWHTIAVNAYNEPLQYKIDSLVIQSILQITRTQVNYDTIAVRFLRKYGFDINR